MPSAVWRVFVAVLSVATSTLVASPAWSSTLLESRHHGAVLVLVNADDVHLGLRYRFQFAAQGRLGGYAHILGRPWDETVEERLRQRVYIQYRETRTLVGGGIAAELPITNVFQAVFTGGAAYTYGDYEGTAHAPAEGWTPTVSAELSWGVPTEDAWICFGTGYFYGDMRSVAPNRFQVFVEVAW